MRVLQINSVCGIGSTGRIATDIHAILKEHGHESYIAFGRGNPINCDTSVRIGNKYDNYAHVIKTRIFDRHGFGSKRATREFVEKVKEINPDVIHLHNIHGYYINVEILFEYLKEANKPVIWTLHDCWAFTGHCSHFDFINCDRWKTGCFDCPQKKMYPSSLMVDNSKNNYLKKKEIFTGVKNLIIVTPSEWLSRLVKCSFLGEYPIMVINNGIDLEIFKPTNSDFRKRYGVENKFVILGVANVWGERKGLNQFMALSEKLEHDEVIILVGLTEEQKGKLPKNIIGITRTNNIKELVEIYTTADVFINPTLEDNFPTTNLESLACGTPVITFKTGGSVECIDKNTGIIVDKGNIQGLCRAIKKIKDRQTDIHSKYCIQKAERFFNKNERFIDYLSVYRGLIEGEG